jgi:uncharacterized protein DUF2750
LRKTYKAIGTAGNRLPERFHGIIPPGQQTSLTGHGGGGIEMSEIEEDSEANHKRFIAKVVEGEHVWGLSTQEGFLACESDGNEERAVLPFWSDAELARGAQGELEGSEADSIELFDFLFRWLPGMADDDVLVGTDWSPALEGKEVDPLDLQDEILDAMSDDMRVAYLDRLAREVQEANESTPE